MGEIKSKHASPVPSQITFGRIWGAVPAIGIVILLVIEGRALTVRLDLKLRS